MLKTEIATFLPHIILFIVFVQKCNIKQVWLNLSDNDPDRHAVGLLRILTLIVTLFVAHRQKPMKNC